jgi:hypothetical protein
MMSGRSAAATSHPRASGRHRTVMAHSEKPEEVRRRIERFYVGPRLSCFAAFRATVSGRRAAAQQGDEVAPSEP